MLFHNKKQYVFHFQVVLGLQIFGARGVQATNPCRERNGKIPTWKLWVVCPQMSQILLKIIQVGIMYEI